MSELNEFGFAPRRTATEQAEYALKLGNAVWDAKKTVHISPDVYQTLRWIADDLCTFCGSKHGEGKERYACFCRKCDSCTSDWVATTRRELNDGRPSTEDCPDCQGPVVVAADVLHAAVFGSHTHPCPSNYCNGQLHSCSEPYDCQPGSKLCTGCYVMLEQEIGNDEEN